MKDESQNYERASWVIEHWDTINVKQVEMDRDVLSCVLRDMTCIETMHALMHKYACHRIATRWDALQDIKHKKRSLNDTLEDLMAREGI